MQQVLLPVFNRNEILSSSCPCSRIYWCLTWYYYSHNLHIQKQHVQVRSDAQDRPQEINNILCTCTYTKGENPPWRTTWQQASFKLLVQSRKACSRQRSVSSYITSELGRQHVHGRIHWCKCKPSHILGFTFVFSSGNVGKMLRWKLLWGHAVNVWDCMFEIFVLRQSF